MHIKITPLDARPEDAVSELEAQPGLVSAYVMRPMDQQQPVLVSVWETAGYAGRSSIASGGQEFANGEFVGSDSADEPPAYGQIVYFDGPRPQSEADAIDRANRDRIGPAVRSIPGNLGAFVGRNPDGSFVVVALTASLQAIEDSQRAIMSTDLLPGEDPADLAGPDRMHLAWVLAASSRTAPLPA
ncbi:MAG: hypothetical protein M3381_05085 [Actinomycetota bacterium]|nr:hypothetical protein [Actinomycetota bacterium]